MDNELLEQLAKLAHDQWSGWMEYLFGKCAVNNETGEAVIPQWAVDRWTRQIYTPYAELSEEEKNSDREEAKRMIAVFERCGA